MKVSIKGKRNVWGKMQWRWRVVSDNNKIVAASTESFVDRRNCVDNMHLTFKALREYVDPTNKTVS